MTGGKLLDKSKRDLASMQARRNSQQYFQYIDLNCFY